MHLTPLVGNACAKQWMVYDIIEHSNEMKVKCLHGSGLIIKTQKIEDYLHVNNLLKMLTKFINLSNSENTTEVLLYLKQVAKLVSNP